MDGLVQCLASSGTSTVSEGLWARVSFMESWKCNHGNSV